MLCDKCKKNEATVHIKEFHGGSCKTMHLCNECARQQNSELSLPDLNNLGVNLAEVLFNIEKFAKTVQSASQDQPEDETKTTELTCPVCHWTASMIKNSGGKLGCPECYRAFGKMISDAITRIQRGAIHLGKRPGNTGPESPARLQAELRNLQDDLKRMIAGEEYEAAAVCRDRINALKEQLASSEDAEAGR